MCTTFNIRVATADDADTIGRLAGEFADYLRRLGDTSDFKFDDETYLRDGYGANPAFSGLVAEIDGKVAGYLLYHFGYDVDNAARILHVIDLYVDAGARGRGLGRALMSAAVKIAQGAGAIELFWAVYIPNRVATLFYERLGASYTKDLRFMKLRV